jgi:GT2 family glycosyltransferase
MTAPRVSVVVLNWNNGAATAACLRALATTDYPALSIIVVDNASTDGSAEQFAGAAGIELVRNDANLGFTGGVNTGIRRAMANGADYVWLLNSDAVVAPDVLTKLVAAAERDPRIGLASPVFRDPDPPYAWEVRGARFDPRSRLATLTDDPATARDWSDRYPDQIVLLGTALLVRRALIEKIGGLDDRFFAYVEDVDFSLRSIAAGFRNVAVQDAIVEHRFKRPVEQPGDVPPYLHYFISRNYPLLWRKLPGRAVMSKSMLWFVRERLLQITRMRNDTAAVDAVLAGLWDGWRGVGGPYDPTRRMPAPLRPLLARYPGLWLALLDGRIGREKSTR